MNDKNEKAQNTPSIHKAHGVVLTQMQQAAAGQLHATSTTCLAA
jgi:hypothetical protein